MVGFNTPEEPRRCPRYFVGHLDVFLSVPYKRFGSWNYTSFVRNQGTGDERALFDI